METAYALSELKPIAQQIIAQWKHPILLLEAPMGAGKTTLIKALCSELGVMQAVSSPTFSLVNSYQDSEGKTLYHFDLYRLNSLEEALDIGIEEYLDSGARCMIEWPERIRPLLSDAFHQIQIEPLGADTRKLIFDA
ncbi:MAG: tRNA (adenosine(37)-N6)-threonylcarbamoyltransferase complex ATPase subunit type 1 TsaE [Flavobacteriales bacterium]|nr:tRNA (adenosine(37)-N6)-threonylcarbamoyltransferase complex ATPase subunit type 1 TsaE [Flavobacteriales bacterium]